MTKRNTAGMQGERMGVAMPRHVSPKGDESYEKKLLVYFLFAAVALLAFAVAVSVYGMGSAEVNY